MLMVDARGPSLFELARQALSSTERGYDLLAEKFDQTPFRTPDVVIERALDGLGSITDAIDLCTGTGAALPKLRALATGRVVGVDFSQGMLDVARHRLGEASTIELVRRDVFELGYEDAFDLATSFGALGHIVGDDEVRFLSAVRRALRVGGRFVFVTSEAPRVLSRQFLLGSAFNLAMRARNALVTPPFIMVYLTFLLPEITRKLRFYGFETACQHGLFEGPLRPLVRVVATKR